MSGQNSIPLLPDFDASISRHTPKLYPPPPDGSCRSRPASRLIAIFRQPAEPPGQTAAPFYHAAGPFYQLAELFRQTAGRRCQLAEQFGQTAGLLDGLAESICRLAESFCQAAFPAKRTPFPCS
jgi:hypothetical protein